MKRIKFIFALAAMVALIIGFSSCSDNEKSVRGTSWVNVLVFNNNTMRETITITFTSGTAGRMDIVLENIAGAEPVLIEEETILFTYTFHDPIVKITYFDEEAGEYVTNTGTVRGSNLRLNMHMFTNPVTGAVPNVLFRKQ